VNPRDYPAWLVHLADEDYEFIRKFVLASGSLKDLARQYDVSYPTIRLRLDRLIERIEIADKVPATDILQARIRLLVANGDIAEPVGKQLLQLHRSVNGGKK
jgi:hypothetical protein